jgi:hypothetical protein
VTVIGLVFTYDGYGLADQLLAWIGWLAGAGAGGSAGWFAATSMSGNPDRLVLTAVGLAAGAIIGRILVPLVSWLAVKAICRRTLSQYSASAKPLVPAVGYSGGTRDFIRVVTRRRICSRLAMLRSAIFSIQWPVG